MKRDCVLHLLLAALFTVGFLTTQGQNVGINNSGAQPHASAMLDVNSTTKGMLVPRMTTAQRTTISNPAKGLMVYDTDTNGFWFYNGGTWALVGGNASGVFVNEAGTVHNTGSLTTDNFLFGRNVAPATGEALADNFLFFDKVKGAFWAGVVEPEETYAAPENIGQGSFSGGHNNMAKGTSSVALGLRNRATGSSAVAIGASNYANGVNSVAVGTSNTASGESAFSAGGVNISSGIGSTTLGLRSKAGGFASVAIGESIISDSYAAMGVGMYNYSPEGSTGEWVASDPLFMIGNGKNNAGRNNAVMVLKNGNVGIGTSTPQTLLHVVKNSSSGSGQLLLEEVADGLDGARVSFKNSARPTKYWDLYGATSNTNADARFNFWYQGAGNILQLKGDGNAILMGVLTQNSDARLKTNITSITRSMEAIQQLNGYHYQWKDAQRDQQMQTGLLAQEVEKVMPELVKQDPLGTKSVNYSGLVPYLLEAVKELKQEIEALKASHK